MPGRHRDPTAGRPYTVVALLAAIFLVAGAGALLRPTGSAPSAAPAAAPGTAAGSTASAGMPAGSPTSAVPAPPTATAPGAPSPTRSASRVERMEDEVRTLVNVERGKAGCAAVHSDSRLRTAARGHSADMAVRNYFDHNTPEGLTPWDRARRAGYQQAIGENIGYGYRTAADVMAGWMNSSGHRANILNCAARAIGVGLAYNAGGTPYWTQLFGSV